MLNLDQFMNIRFLRRQSHSVRAIAGMTGHARNTVRKLLRATRALSHHCAFAPVSSTLTSPTSSSVGKRTASPQSDCIPRSKPKASPVHSKSCAASCRRGGPSIASMPS